MEFMWRLAGERKSPERQAVLKALVHDLGEILECQVLAVSQLGILPVWHPRQHCSKSQLMGVALLGDEELTRIGSAGERRHNLKAHGNQILAIKAYLLSRRDFGPDTKGTAHIGLDAAKARGP